MKLTKDELISLISDVTTLLRDALAKHAELVEATVGSSVGVEIQRKKLDVLKTKLADENRKLTRLKDAAKRKRELEKINRPGPRR
jgi:hypothetical protein